MKEAIRTKRTGCPALASGCDRALRRNKMRTNLKTIIFVLVTLAVFTTLAAGNVALNPGGVAWPTDYQQYGPVTCGWTFQPNQDIVVTKLGLHLPNVAPWSGGFLENHQIAIWGSSGTEVVSGTIASGVPAASGDNNYVYIDVSSVTLSSSETYIIGAYFASATDPWINAFAGGYGSDPAITIIQTGMITVGSPFQMPTSVSSYLSSPNFQFEIAPSVITVQIDIKPGSYPNSVNLGSNGVVPVAILTDDLFDATTVNPETVNLAGAGVAIRGKGNKYLAHEQDVNDDGLIDLVLQVETENLDPGQFQDGYAILAGATYGGQAIEGMDEITIVPPE